MKPTPIDDTHEWPQPGLRVLLMRRHGDNVLTGVGSLFQRMIMGKLIYSWNGWRYARPPTHWCHLPDSSKRQG